MIVDRAWAKRNLGFDPIATPAPASTFAFSRAAHSPSSEDLGDAVLGLVCSQMGAKAPRYLAVRNVSSESMFLSPHS
jgi:hypothetical protein